MDGAGRLLLLQLLQARQQACRCLRTWRETDRLLALLSGIVEPELRLHLFGEYLHDRPPEEAAWTISRLWDRMTGGDRKVQGVCLGLLDLNRLTRVVPSSYLNAVRGALERHGETSAGLLAQETKRRDAAETEIAPPPKEPVGYRISLARRPVPRLIERMLFDPEPRVIQTVLANPRLSETEVVRLAASRRAPPEALEAIAADDRWIARYPVKLALANNPAAPSRLVLRLLPYLMRQDLRDLAAGAFSATVREQAAALLARRQGSEG
ncbi:MAG TPA: hypothetical protein VLM91_01310 [Candidatus Methylomirabilis sp.]|nr:hypothetical protein [Candidatus Methylomirabilis sp.]